MKKVYIADDDNNIIEIIKMTLSKENELKTEYFDNGLDLYRAIQKNIPDAVVTDIILPKLEGLPMTRLLKFDEFLKKIKVLVISSVIDPDIDEQIKRVKADDFLRKPFKPSELKEKIHKLFIEKEELSDIKET